MSHIVQQFDRIRRDAPGRPLIHVPAPSGSTTLTAEDVWTRSLEQGKALEALGLDSDHLVISAAGNRAAAVPLWLACLRLGIALMPVDAGTPIAEIVDLAGRFGAATVVGPPGFADGQAAWPSTAMAGGLSAAQLPLTPQPQIYKGAAALKVTSGSTGLPKATFTREAQLVADHASIAAAMDIRPDDCQIAAIPLSHAYAIGNLVLPLLLQGTAFVLREGFVPQQVRADATAYSARVFPGVPFMFAHFAANRDVMPWPAPLERAISAGAPLDHATAVRFFESFGVKIHTFYGASETGGISFDDSDEIGSETTVGRAMPAVTISIRREEGAPEGSGRVHVAGPAVSSGYAGQPSADLGFVDDGYLTGDFGHFRGDRLLLTGRASSFINVAGKKVLPDEVEAIVRQIDGVEAVSVMGADDERRGQQVVACIVKRGADLDERIVRQHCASRLSAHKVPRTIVWLDNLPLTERGKLDRAALARIVQRALEKPR